jgi:hypothetical protein
MYRFDQPQMGYPQIELVLPVQALVQPAPFWSRGYLVAAEDPVFGPGEFVFGQANGNIRPYGLCTMLEVWDATNKMFIYNFTECVATANIGTPLYVFQGNAGGVAGATVAISAGQYGWFMNSGRTPVNSSASIAAGVNAGHGAGQVVAQGAGTQILNSKVITPATQTVVSPAVAGVAGIAQVTVQNTAGFFPGVYVSGTGIGAAAICTGVDPIGKVLTLSVVNSAAVTGNVTATYNNATIFYNVLSMNRAFAQGAIT